MLDVEPLAGALIGGAVRRVRWAVCDVHRPYRRTRAAAPAVQPDRQTMAIDFANRSATASTVICSTFVLLTRTRHVIGSAKGKLISVGDTADSFRATYWVRTVRVGSLLEVDRRRIVVAVQSGR